MELDGSKIFWFEALLWTFELGIMMSVDIMNIKDFKFFHSEYGG